MFVISYGPHICAWLDCVGQVVRRVSWRRPSTSTSKSLGQSICSFWKTSAKGNDSSVVKKQFVKESVRRQGLPAWIDMLWFDLAKTRQVIVAAHLGQKGLNVAGSGLDPASSGGVRSARRAELASELAKHNPGKLPGEFWRTLGLPSCLPAHMRPKVARR